jgi:flavin-binding protein dodecin
VLAFPGTFLVKENEMSVARVTEIIAASPKSFDDAIKAGTARAAKTLKNVKGAWVQDQELILDDGNIKEYRVHLKVTFVLTD